MSRYDVNLCSHVSCLCGGKESTSREVTRPEMKEEEEWGLKCFDVMISCHVCAAAKSPHREKSPGLAKGGKPPDGRVSHTHGHALTYVHSRRCTNTRTKGTRARTSVSALSVCPPRPLALSLSLSLSLSHSHSKIWRHLLQRWNFRAFGFEL